MEYFFEYRANHVQGADRWFSASIYPEASSAAENHLPWPPAARGARCPVTQSIVHHFGVANMKPEQKLCEAAFVAAMLLVPAAATAADGTVTFSGSVVTASCSVTSGANQTVTLPAVRATDLAYAGLVYGSVSFSFNVGGCGADTLAYPDFTGTSVASDGNLANTGTASHVEVKVLDNYGNTVNFNGAAGAQNVTAQTVPAGGQSIFRFSAEYYATGAASGGSVAALTTFTMVYQ